MKAFAQALVRAGRLGYDPRPMPAPGLVVCRTAPGRVRAGAGRVAVPAYAAAVGLYVELSHPRKRCAVRGPWMEYELPDGAIG